MSAINKLRYSHGCRLIAALLGLVILLAVAAVPPAAAADMPVAVKPIAVLGVDDDGAGLSYPSMVFFDPSEEEIYLINGGTSRIIVYGPDFFPRYSIGKGRSVAYPRGIHIMPNGQVYVAQGVNRANPVRRITILNGAFFVDREILLDEIPEAAGFSPRQLAVSRDGKIYVTSDRHRGVLVLDRDGNFLRWLKPLDLIFDRKAIAETARELEAAEQKRKAEQADLAGTDEEGGTVATSSADIPAEYRPGGGDGDEGGTAGKGLGAVRVNHVSIDSTGKLYLVSTETSKTYVYNAEEKFLFSFGEKGGTPRKLSQPRSLAIDEKKGIIYIVDYTRHSVLVFSLTGEYLYEFGGRGFQPGYFNFPVSIAINNKGEIIVADLFNKRVQVLDVKYDENMFKVKPTEKEETLPASGADAGESVPPAEDAAVTPGGGESPPAAAEGEPAAESVDKVEEVVVPDRQIPAQPAPDSQPPSPAATPPGQPAAPLEKPPVGVPAPEGKVVYPVEPTSIIEVPASPAPPASESPSESKPEEPEAVIEEQIVPEQKVPAYPDDKPK